MQIEAGGDRAVATDALSAYWRAGPGGSVGVAVPFYAGEMAGTVRLARFSSRTEAQPDFTALQSTLTWRYPVRYGVVSLAPGLRAGLLAMTFDADLSRYGKTESEVLLGLSGRVEVGTQWRFFAEAAAEHIFFAEPVTTVWLTFGTGYRFATPRWLRSFLD